MNAKARIKRAEDAIKPRDQLEIIWLEPDESGNYPPAPPGSQHIIITWDGTDNPDQEAATLPAAAE